MRHEPASRLRARLVQVLFTVVVLGLAGASPGAAQDPEPAPQRPRPSPLPQEEDWSVLGLADGREPYDGLKHIALDSAGDWRLTLGLSARARGEGWSAFSFGQSTAANDFYYPFRILPHADLKHASGARAFLQLKSAFTWDRDLPGGDRPADEDVFDVQQAFLEYGAAFGDGRVALGRIGRQMLAYGRQRLVSPSVWGNTLRHWDAALVRYEGGSWTIDGFFSEFVPSERDWFDAGNGNHLFGLYAAREAGPGGGQELYWLGRTSDLEDFNGTTGEDDRHTLGVRSWGGLGAGVDYEVELAVQLGNLGPSGIFAGLAGFELGYRAADSSLRFKAGAEYGSGDSTPGGDSHTVDALYGSGHSFFGQVDAIGRSNALDLLGGTSWTAAPNVTIELVGHLFWKAVRGDGVYNAAGALYTGTAGGSRDVGREIDLLVKGAWTRHVSWEVGYAHLFAGRAFTAVGLDEDTDFAYVQLSYAF